MRKVEGKGEYDNFVEIQKAIGLSRSSSLRMASSRTEAHRGLPCTAYVKAQEEKGRGEECKWNSLRRILDSSHLTRMFPGQSITECTSRIVYPPSTSSLTSCRIPSLASVPLFCRPPFTHQLKGCSRGRQVQGRPWLPLSHSVSLGLRARHASSLSAARIPVQLQQSTPASVASLLPRGFNARKQAPSASPS